MSARRRKPRTPKAPAKFAVPAATKRRIAKLGRLVAQLGTHKIDVAIALCQVHVRKDVLLLRVPGSKRLFETLWEFCEVHYAWAERTTQYYLAVGRFMEKYKVTRAAAIAAKVSKLDAIRRAPKKALVDGGAGRLVREAAALSLDKVKAKVNKLRAKAGKPSIGSVRFNIPMPAAVLARVTETLRLAEAECGSSDPARCLETVMGHYGEKHGTPGPERLQQLIASIERAHDVRLVVYRVTEGRACIEHGDDTLRRHRAAEAALAQVTQAGTAA